MRRCRVWSLRGSRAEGLTGGTGGLEMNWIWEILRYVAAWGGTGLIIWFWYWMFSSIGTF
jgi:hypothetical protein